MELHSILVTDCLITFLVHTKTVQEFPDPSFRALVMQYIQRCGKGRVWVRDYSSGCLVARESQRGGQPLPAGLWSHFLNITRLQSSEV